MTRTGDPQVPDRAGETVDPELLEVFLQEAEGHLRAIRSHLPALGEGGADAVQAVRRAAHTLKGSAAMVGFRPLTRLAHRMEDLLDRIHEGLPSTPDIIDLLTESADRLDDLAAGHEDAAALDGLYARYDGLVGAAGAASPAPPPEESVAPPAVRDAEAADPDHAAAESFVRVPLRRLDEIVRLVSDLTVARAALEQRMAACSRQIEELQRGLERLPGCEQGSESGDRDRLTREAAAAGQELGRLGGDAEDLLGRQARLTTELHDRLMHVRLAPFGTLAARLRRTVRQVAEQSQKPVDLTLEGEAVEVDKAVLEEMAEPLMHLLRNAVDHGVEPADRRRERGKPERGRLTVQAAHEGDQVVLRVSDNGGGVDVDAVRARAVERGLASPEAAAGMTEPQLFALVFRPGFSTAREISETSGRGVGLDVVRAGVERLKGSVTLTSRRGEWTTFVVRLPMTVAVTRALMVRSYGQTFALPLAAVARVARIGAEAVEGPEGRIRIGDESYSCVVLGEALRLRLPEAAGEAGWHGQLAARATAVLLLETGEGRAAVVVDDVQGGREIVVKNLGTHLHKIHGVSGATLTGDGGVVLILNPAECTRPPFHGQLAARAARPLSVLVVDDSPSMRRGLMSLIEGQGWTATAACDGQEGLEFLSAGPRPDVMLVDVDMPRMNGYEFLSAVKGSEAHRGVPVVMVTSRAGGHDRRQAEERGADGYIVKPYHDEELLATVRRLTGMAPAESAVRQGSAQE